MASISFPLDGLFQTSPEVRGAAATDFGRIVSHEPLAVARPRTIDEVREVIRFARAHRLPVAARGRGHSTFGQAQARGGVVLDMAGLARVREFDRTSAWVDGGCSWSDLIDRTVPEGLAPPALTDYLGLSVGGTLSVGGIGGASFRHGAQTDNVLELEVVTGAGDFVRCSAREHEDLFDAMRAGLGQCGVIVGARVRLVPIPARVTVTQLVFETAELLLSAQRTLAQGDLADYLDGTIVADGTGGHRCVLTVVNHDHGAAFDANDRAPGGTVSSVRQCEYTEFAHRVQDYVNHLIQMGVWDAPHPWLDLFLANQRAAGFVSEAARELHEERDGMILTYVLRRSLCRTPLLALPQSEEWVFLIDLLRNTPSDGVLAALDGNARLTQVGVSLGAGIYPIGSMPSANWLQLAPGWKNLELAKQQFDPDHVMTPGQGPAEAGHSSFLR